jgi:predicted FMN-binding regulatory protein PaiB
MAESIKDKVTKAQKNAKGTLGGVDFRKTKKLVKQNAKESTGQKLSVSELRRSAKIVQTRRQNDADRTLARGKFIEKRETKKASEARIIAAVGGVTKKKK